MLALHLIKAIRDRMNDPNLPVLAEIEGRRPGFRRRLILMVIALWLLVAYLIYLGLKYDIWISRVRVEKDRLTNKDSIERSAPTMNEWNHIAARSLNAIWGWTSPGLSCLFLFMPLSRNELQKPAVEADPGTDGSVPQMCRTVQSAFWGRNSRVARDGAACRAAAQSNPPATEDAAMTLLFVVEARWRGASDQDRSAALAYA
jgi:hypothetical protein